MCYYSKNAERSEQRVLMSVRARDEDVAMNGLVAYTLSLGGQATPIPLRIDSHTGHIYTNLDVDANAAMSTSTTTTTNDMDMDVTLAFNVSARDHGQPHALHSTIMVRLRVTNKPGIHFAPSVHKLLVPLSSTLSAIDTNANATTWRRQEIARLGDSLVLRRRRDPTNVTMPNVMYSIVAGNDELLFDIDCLNGSLYMTSRSRSLQQSSSSSHYRLVVSAIELGSAAAADNTATNASVLIQLIDAQIDAGATTSSATATATLSQQEQQWSSNALLLDGYEYQVDMFENTAAMTPLFALATHLRNVSGRLAGSGGGGVRFKLLNHLDAFYVHETSGVVYNKRSFDYDYDTIADSSSSSSMTRRSARRYVQLKLAVEWHQQADNNPMQQQQQQQEQRVSESSSCRLTVRIRDRNDNAPRFDKSVYTSRVQLDDDDDHFEPSSSSSSSSSANEQFVAKVSATDVDIEASVATPLVYRILHQSVVDQDDRVAKWLVARELFAIGPASGIVHLRLDKYEQLVTLVLNSPTALPPQTPFEIEFALDLSVSDSIFTTYARLNVTLAVHTRAAAPSTSLHARTSTRIMRPVFRRNYLRLHVHARHMRAAARRHRHLLRLLKLSEQLDEQSPSTHLSICDDASQLFSVDALSSHLSINVTRYHRMDEKKKKTKTTSSSSSWSVYPVAVVACDERSGACDQLLVLINVTHLAEASSAGTTNGTLTDSSLGEVESEQALLNRRMSEIAFAYKYWSVTLRQTKSSAELSKRHRLHTNGGGGGGGGKQRQLPTTSDDNDDDSSMNYDDGIDVSASNKDEDEDENIDNETESEDDDDDDEYLLEETYEANERFYIELKTLDYGAAATAAALVAASNTAARRRLIKFEFDLIDCQYTPFDTTSSNTTNSSSSSSSSSSNSNSTRSYKSQFAVQRHSGTLTSKKPINKLFAGTYALFVSLRLRKLSNATSAGVSANGGAAVAWRHCDTMQLRLVVLPAPPASPNVNVYFRFDKLFYKFVHFSKRSTGDNSGHVTMEDQESENSSFEEEEEGDELGRVHLVGRAAARRHRRSSYVVSYSLVDANKQPPTSAAAAARRFSFQMDAVTGILRVITRNHTTTAAAAALDLIADSNVVLYVLARVRFLRSAAQTSAAAHMLPPILEYMTEVSVRIVWPANTNIVSSSPHTSATTSTGLVNNQKQRSEAATLDSSAKEMVRFGEKQARLLNIFIPEEASATLPVVVPLFRFVALLDSESEENSDSDSDSQATEKKELKKRSYRANLVYSLEMPNMSKLFHLDARTGLLSVRNATIATASAPLYRLNVSACLHISDDDHDDGDNEEKRCTYARLDVHIAHSQASNRQQSQHNNNNVYFEQSRIDGAIREDALPGTVIATMHASSSSSSSNRSSSSSSATIHYTIMSGDPLNQFAITDADAKVYTRLPLEREHSSAYTLTIGAHDGRQRWPTLANLSVRVLLSDDDEQQQLAACLLHWNASSSLLELEVDETAPVGHVLHSFKKNYLPMLRYELLASDSDDRIAAPSQFEIDSAGALRLASRLDYEKRRAFAPFYVRISSKRSGASSANANDVPTQQQPQQQQQQQKQYCMVKVSVRVLDANDQAPVFDAPLYTASVLEHSPRGTVVHRVHASDRDTAPRHARLFYSLLLSSNDSTNIDDELLAIDRLTGLVWLNSSSSSSVDMDKQLDRERLGEWLNVSVRASDERGELAASVPLHVRIVDINDNRPLFASATERVSVDESAPVGLLVHTVRAVDADSTTATEYYLLNSTSDDNDDVLLPFVVDKQSGEVRLSGSLDFETQRNYTLRVLALDAELTESPAAVDHLGHASVTHVLVNVLDVNDNAPVFEPLQPLNLSLAENAPIGTIVCTVRATDADARATNNSRLEYRLLAAGNQLGLFAIESVTGRLYVAAPIDYDALVLASSEASSPSSSSPPSSLKRAGGGYVFALTVECSDSGVRPRALSSRLTIHVSVRDLNDNAPLFAAPVNRTVTLRHSLAAPGHEILARLQVADRDANHGAPFRFVIVEQAHVQSLAAASNASATSVALVEPLFEVEASSGRITLLRRPMPLSLIASSSSSSSSSSLETGVFAVYQLRVRCFDSGTPKPLHSDAFVTVRFGSDESVATHLSIPAATTTLTMTTNGSSQLNVQVVLVEESSVASMLAAGQLIANMNHPANALAGTSFELDAVDDDDDTLSRAQLHARFEINRRSGLLRTRTPLGAQQPPIRFKTLANNNNNNNNNAASVSVRVSSVARHCFVNSLFVQFQMWSGGGGGDASQRVFVQLGYLSRLQDALAHILLRQQQQQQHNPAPLTTKDNNQTRPDILIIGVKEWRARRSLSGHTSSSPLISVEVLLAVVDHSAVESEERVCLSSKLVVKLLSKRKSTLLRRMQATPHANYQLKIVEMAANRDCRQQQQQQQQYTNSVCMTNSLRQTCRLDLSGTFTHPVDSLCQQQQNGVRSCLLLPSYNWTCASSPSSSSKDNNGAPRRRPASTPVQSCKKPHNPCQNNAICKQLKDSSASSSSSSANASVAARMRVHCFCPNGFKGRYCQYDVDECNGGMSVDASSSLTSSTSSIGVSSPCAPHAKCINTYGSFTCHCDESDTSPGFAPPTSCYNTLYTAQFSASKMREPTSIEDDDDNDDDHDDNDQDDLYYNDTTESADDDQVKQVGTDHITTRNRPPSVTKKASGNGDWLDSLFHTLSADSAKQSLVGLFVGLCVIVLVLAVFAGILCKTNAHCVPHQQQQQQQHQMPPHSSSSLLGDPTSTSSYRLDSYRSSARQHARHHHHHHHGDDVFNSSSTCAESNSEQLSCVTSAPSSSADSNPPDTAAAAAAAASKTRRQTSEFMSKQKATRPSRFRRNKQRSTIKTSLLGSAAIVASSASGAHCLDDDDDDDDNVNSDKHVIEYLKKQQKQQEQQQKKDAPPPRSWMFWRRGRQRSTAVGHLAAVDKYSHESIHLVEKPQQQARSSSTSESCHSSSSSAAEIPCSSSSSSSSSTAEVAVASSAAISAKGIDEADTMNQVTMPSTTDNSSSNCKTALSSFSASAITTATVSLKANNNNNKHSDVSTSVAAEVASASNVSKFNTLSSFGHADTKVDTFKYNTANKPTALSAQPSQRRPLLNAPSSSANRLAPHLLLMTDASKTLDDSMNIADEAGGQGKHIATSSQHLLYIFIICM